MIEAQRAAIYCRISKDPDGTMLGVERQRADCLKLAASRGWPVAATYIDNDLSAYSGAVRPEYGRMLDDMRAGAVDAVLAWHPDRLHRSPRELEGFIDVVEARGIAVETVTAGAIDLGTPSGRAVARTLGAWGRYESEHKAERIRRKHEELAAAGIPIRGGTRPFGLTVDWSAPVPAEAALIREAAARVLAGSSLRSICADWNARGIVTATGGRWQQQPLRRMLTAGRLAGIRDYQGRSVQGSWPAIVDLATLDRLRAVLLDPGRRTTNVRARRYLLAGQVLCGACGGRMVARPRADHVRRYICASGPMFEGCGKTFIIAEPLEELIAEAVLTRLDSPEFEEALRTAARPSEAASTLRDDEKALEQLARDHYADRIIGRAEFLAARSSLDARIETARRRLSAEVGAGALGATVGGARARWPVLDFDQRRAVLGQLIEAITIGPGRRGYNRFDAGRVDVRWRV